MRGAQAGSQDEGLGEEGGREDPGGEESLLAREHQGQRAPQRAADNCVKLRKETNKQEPAFKLQRN